MFQIALDAHKLIFSFEIWLAQIIDTSTVFSTFDWDQLAKIRQQGWKERVIISKVAKFESVFLPPYKTSVKFRDFVEQYIRSLWTNRL